MSRHTLHIRDALLGLVKSLGNGGMLLALAALAALIVSNSPAQIGYERFLNQTLLLAAGPVRLEKSLLHWINDGLMVIFFFLIGLELKREFVRGHLSSLAKVRVPVFAAAGGMLGPALIFLAFNGADPELLRGWAIPTATDIAFSLGVLAILSTRVPPGLKAFLLALAILDDLGAVLIIALYYTADLSWQMLGYAAACLGALLLLNRLRVAHVWLYLLLGVALWYFVLKSGVHATIAGVLLAFAIPAGRGREPHDLLERLEHRLHRPVALGILPLFAFCNAGVNLSVTSPADLASPLTRPAGGQAARHLRLLRPRRAPGARSPARRRPLAASAGPVAAVRHRLHHEPVRRRARLRRRRASAGREQARHPRRLPAVGAAGTGGAGGDAAARRRSAARMSTALRALLGAACLVVLAAALQQARDIVVPFLLAAFLAVACAPPMAWLRGRGVPNALALLLVAAGIVAAGAGLAALVGASIQEFHRTLPAYYAQLRDAASALERTLAAQRLLPGASLLPELDPSFFLQFVSRILSGFGAILTDTFLILFAALLLLAESPQLSARARRILQRRADGGFSLDTFGDSVHRYLAIKTLTSALTGLLVALWLALLGIPHAVLWGLVAFLLNYIPTIGSILAAVPAVLLAALFGGAAAAGLAALGYAVVNVGVGMFLENLLLGRQLQLSVLVVFVSLVFWGWLLGPVGMLLSIPLTVIIKLGLESSPRTRLYAELLGSARASGPG